MIQEETKRIQDIIKALSDYAEESKKLGSYRLEIYLSDLEVLLSLANLYLESKEASKPVVL